MASGAGEGFAVAAEGMAAGSGVDPGVRLVGEGAPGRGGGGETSGSMACLRID